LKFSVGAYILTYLGYILTVCAMYDLLTTLGVSHLASHLAKPGVRASFLGHLPRECGLKAIELKHSSIMMTHGAIDAPKLWVLTVHLVVCGLALQSC